MRTKSWILHLDEEEMELDFIGSYQITFGIIYLEYVTTWLNINVKTNVKKEVDPEIWGFAGQNGVLIFLFLLNHKQRVDRVFS